MADPSWNGILNYEGTGVGVENNEFTRTTLSGSIAVRYFYVAGGAGKPIVLSSRRSLPVWSELDQAKKNGNIIFGLRTDVTSASHLQLLAQAPFPISIVFSVIGSNGKGRASVYNLRTKKATFRQGPLKAEVYGEPISFVQFEISDCELVQGIMGMKLKLLGRGFNIFGAGQSNEGGR